MLKKLLVIDRIRAFIKVVKFEALILWMACKHKETSFLVKALGFLILAYAFSPIDLIPDFIPLIGYLDELILLPILIAIALKFLPKDIYKQSEEQAKMWLEEKRNKPKLRLGLLLIPLCWVLIIYLVVKTW
jgi:uncharacterized membrane protein YkvA (DUF1232 family)